MANSGFFMDMKEFLKHPVEYFIKHSGLYQKSIQEKNQIIEDRDRLKKDCRIIAHKNEAQGTIIARLTTEKTTLANKMRSYDQLREDYLGCKKEAIKLQEDYLRCRNEALQLQKDYLKCQKESIPLQEENAHLRRDLENRTQELVDIIYDVENALETCMNVRTGYDVIEARANENKGANDALETWIQYQKHPYEEKIKKMEKELLKTQSSIFRIAINSIIQNDSGFDGIPFLYYDFVDKKLIYDDSVKKKFKGFIKGNLTLSSLLKTIPNADLRGKDNDGIINAIREGKALNHYKAKTKGEGAKDLRLTTIPFRYDGNYLGVGIFLWDPRFSKQAIKDYRAGRKIEKIVEGISKGFDKIKKDTLFGR